jgi:hypothetical protein
MSNNLREQILGVCDKTHDLLGDPMVQLFGDIEQEKITIEVPKAFSYLALYLSMLNENNGKPVSAWGHHEECFKRKYKGQRSAMRCYLENMISIQMHEELHQLSTLKHPLFTTH